MLFSVEAVCSKGMLDADCTPCNVESLLTSVPYHCLMCVVESQKDAWRQHARAPCWKLCEDAWYHVCLQVLATLAVQISYSKLHVLDIGEDMG